jgi:hypothetical protein
MLEEKQAVRQIEGEGFRRWFSDTYFDLIVWYADETQAEIVGFQLCYDKPGTERALTWRKDEGFSHNRIDDGERPFSSKMSPVLVADGVFDREGILRKFNEAADALDSDLAAFIHIVLTEYPGT